MIKRIIIATVMSLILVNAEAQTVTIPSNSFMHGELAHTLNVSVAGDKPTAVLIHLAEKVTIPNGIDTTLSGCDLYGKASADQQSERIYISPEILACKNSKGQFQYITVKGIICDQGGKSGLSAQFLIMPMQEIATVESGTDLDVVFMHSFKVAQ